MGREKRGRSSKEANQGACLSGSYVLVNGIGYGAARCKKPRRWTIKRQTPRLHLNPLTTVTLLCSHDPGEAVKLWLRRRRPVLPCRGKRINGLGMG